MAIREGKLGRRKPDDFSHVTKWRFGAIAPPTVDVVNKSLRLPTWHWEWDQGNEGACVGYGTSMALSLINHHRYDPKALYDAAQLADPWPDTPPAEGTSVSAACDVLRTQGARRVLRGQDLDWDIGEGIAANRWATTTDEMRTCIANGVPVSIGVNWYTKFDNPVNGWAAHDGDDLGSIRGGHCVCVYAASDRYQAFKIKNSWGRDYPLAYIGYGVMQRLLDEDGEATLITDR
jgi:hypothetical protein